MDQASSPLQRRKKQVCVSLCVCVCVFGTERTSHEQLVARLQAGVGTNSLPVCGGWCWTGGGAGRLTAELLSHCLPEQSQC